MVGRRADSDGRSRVFKQGPTAKDWFTLCVRKAGDFSPPLKNACFTQQSCMRDIYQVYYLSYLFNSTLAGQPGLPSVPGCFRPGLSADYFCFCGRKPSNSSLWSAKFHVQVLIS